MLWELCHERGQDKSGQSEAEKRFAAVPHCCSALLLFCFNCRDGEMPPPTSRPPPAAAAAAAAAASQTPKKKGATPSSRNASANNAAAAAAAGASKSGGAASAKGSDAALSLGASANDAAAASSRGKFGTQNKARSDASPALSAATGPSELEGKRVPAHMNVQIPAAKIFLSSQYLIAFLRRSCLVTLAGIHSLLCFCPFSLLQNTTQDRRNRRVSKK